MSPRETATHTVQVIRKLAQEHEKKFSPIELAVEVIEYDLCDRRGLKWAWAEIDKDVKEEIRETWREIIRLTLTTT